VKGEGFRVHGLWCTSRVSVLGLKIAGLGFRLKGLTFRAKGFRYMTGGS
jgi:hypothetical protein